MTPRIEDGRLADPASRERGETCPHSPPANPPSRGNIREKRRRLSIFMRGIRSLDVLPGMVGAAH